ncbi:hypothetical protein MASR2M78_19420 [Treponema sp.]
MKKTITIILFAAVLSLPLFADITVTELRGLVGVLVGAKLNPVQVGLKLQEGAKVVTGANSEVTIDINNGKITLKSLSTAKISGAMLTKNSSVANVSLRNGTVVSEVKQITGLKTSFTITTPVGTSSVRGTTHSVSYNPEQGMRVNVLSGVVDVSSRRGANRPVAAGLNYVADASSSQPQVKTQAEAEIARPGALAIQANELGNGEITDLIDRISNKADSGKVKLSILFP